jgi:hypothetical protein
MVSCKERESDKKELTQMAEKKLRKMTYEITSVLCGSNSAKQGKGSGSEILKYVLDYSKNLDRPVYLETSTEGNLPWHKKYGMENLHRFRLFWISFLFSSVYCIHLEWI